MIIPNFSQLTIPFGLSNYKNKLRKISDLEKLHAGLSEKYKRNDGKKMIFIIEEEVKGISGYTPIGNDISICFKRKDKETIVHELLHALGLLHTYASVPQNGYVNECTYKALKTNNIMDSSPENNDINRISLFYWQWKKINDQLNKLNNDTPQT